MTIKNTFADYLADLNQCACTANNPNPYTDTDIRCNAEMLAHVIMEEYRNNVTFDDSLAEEILAAVTQEILFFIHDNYPYTTPRKQYSDFYDYIKEKYF